MDEKQQTIEEWLDERIAAYNILGKEFNPTGEEDYWECPRCINVHAPDKEIHITGLNAVIKAMSSTPTKHSTILALSDGTELLEQSIRYNGYKFYEVTKIKDKEEK